MDSGHVLLALEEQGKWRERRKRLEERLRQIQSRKRYFAKELEAVRGKIEQFGALLSSLKRGTLESIRTRLSGSGSPR
jgi:chromosome segregation ATPase